MVRNDGEWTMSKAWLQDVSSPALPPPAQFIEPDRREWPEQGKARGQRVEQRNEVVAERGGGQQQSRDRIDQDQENRVRRHRAEIINAQLQRPPQIGEGDGSHFGQFVHRLDGHDQVCLVPSAILRSLWIQRGAATRERATIGQPRSRHVATR